MEPVVVYYSNKMRKALFDRINSLSSTEHEEILKIVKSHNIVYSQNKNGIFFNLSSLSDEAVKDIDNFVVYCISNKKELDEYDKIINECKMSNNIKSIMPPINTSLSHMAKAATSTALHNEQAKKMWENLKLDETSMEKFVKFTDKVIQDKEKIGRKKLNVKFNNARKRFSKKITDRKIDCEQNDILQPENFLIFQDT